MKIVRTKLMRLIGKKYMLLFCWLLTAPKAVISDVDINHEKIHASQMRELLYVLFYVWYIVEWLIRLPKGNAYRSISFEREAYTNENDMEYLSNRKHFAFMKYLWS